jgi:glycosyltransferase involved in cell wall biosynthesis
MRVVIDARIRDGAYGGVQQWVIGLASGLSQLPGDDEYLFLAIPGHHEWLEPYLGGGCRVLYPAPRRPPPRTKARRRLPPALRHLWRLAASSIPALGRIRPSVRVATPRDRSPIARSDGTVEQAGADVVHFSFQAAFLTTVPSIYQPWDLQHLHLPDFFTPEQRAWREASYRAFCAQASLVVTASEWVRQDVIQQYGVEAERIAVVNVPPVTTAYPELRAADLEAIGDRLELPDRFVFYPAQTWPHKNHVRLFEALRLLGDDGVTVPLVCTGLVNASGAGLQQLAVDLGIDANIRFLGYVAPVELKAVYQRARALIFPSLYEGWGLPIVEAFSAGLPVACSNVTSLPKLVDGAALLFDPYDSMAIAAAIRRLWEDETLTEDLARRGRAIASRYDWRRTALIMRSHYRQVAGQALSDEDRALLAGTA